jgi:hypothetical protein
MKYDIMGTQIGPVALVLVETAIVAFCFLMGWLTEKPTKY